MLRPTHLIAIFVLLSSVDIAATADFPAKAPPIIDVPFFIVNDNRLTYAYLPTATNAGGANAGKISKQVVAYTHFDVWAYGTNYANLSYSKSNQLDPANPCSVLANGCAGRNDFFGQLRSTFGFNQLFNTKSFTAGSLRNVSFLAGADVGTSNSFFASATNAGMAGLQFAFDLPYKGFINVAPMYYQEVNRNSFAQCGFSTPPCLTDGKVRYNGTWRVEANYYMALGFLPESVPLAVSGYVGVTGPKGPQNAPLAEAPPVNAQTKTEIISEPIRLTLDAGQVLWGPKYSHAIDVWVAYRYWQNKFGYDHEVSSSCLGRASGSCTENSVYTGISVKY